MGRSIEEFFLHLKPSKIMVRLADPSVENYASALSSEVDSTYSHTVRILQQMEEFDLVRSEKKGRKKEIELTSRGERIAEDLNQLIRDITEG
ncbi:MAG: hypothetical protein ABEJ75_01360 [Candidatus Nanohaloarchaea archaeon]